MRRIVIVGGGPSGMMAAIEAKRINRDDQVVLLERNKELGKKLLLTGGGRCNVSVNVNNETFVKSVPKNGKFLYSAINQYELKSLHAFFENRNCPLIEEDHHRMFPKSGKANDIRKVLKSEMDLLGVEVFYECYVKDVDWNSNKLYTSIGEIEFHKLILACGGMSFEETGSDGTGYQLARSGEHTITELLAMESPLISNDELISSRVLQGLSFRDVELSVFDEKGKRKGKLTHDLLITHFGLSGPLGMRSSYEVTKLLKVQEKVECRIDFTKCPDPLPKRLLQYVENNFEEPEEVLSKFIINVVDVRSLKQAFVTNGGVSVKEIDPKTMKSKILDDLSFCGEIMDVSGYTGGFNITLALITGAIAGRNI